MINALLKEQLKKIKPSKEEIKKIEKLAKDFCKKLKEKIKENSIKAKVFIGGSLPKQTIIKKELYDVDVFIRFSKKYSEKQVSELLRKIIMDLEEELGKKFVRVKGSRDYYILKEKIEKKNENKIVILEIVPVIEIKNPNESRNVTDLSYFHVNYVKKEIKKNPGLADEIRLAKAFCNANRVYGAESYIQGFSGYSLELLIIYYKSFLNFIKKIASSKPKVILDPAKFYKSKEEILKELNEAKLQSPIILIDPTFKERNALAGLSEKTFLKFQKICQEFLKNPSMNFFEKKDLLKELSKKYGGLNILEIKTKKQKIDIAGAKARKFSDFFLAELEKEFGVEEAEFEYNEEENTAKLYFVVKRKPPEIIKGPFIGDIKNLKKFREAHPDSFIKGNRAYAKLYHNLTLDQFFREFIKKHEKLLKEKDIKEINLKKI